MQPLPLRTPAGRSCRPWASRPRTPKPIGSLHTAANGMVVATNPPVEQLTDVTKLQSEVAKLREENSELRAELERWRASASDITNPAAAVAANLVEDVAAVALAEPPAPALDLNQLAALLQTMPVEEVEHKVEPQHLRELLTQGIRWPSAGERFWERPARNEPFPLTLEDSLRIPEQIDGRKLHIVHVAAELAPIGKVGGLGDVVAGLSKACMERGHNVAIIMPFYESLNKSQIEGLRHEIDIDVPKGYVWDGQIVYGALRTSVFWGRVAGVPVYFIRPADWNACGLFRGGRIYGGSYDDREAYLYFCRAALEYLRASGQQPHILQVHDWHTAALPMLYWEAYHADGLFKPRVVMTIHNMENTGEVRQDEFMATGMPGEAFATIDKALDERTIGHNPERLNLMKGGIIYSNAVTTVSPSYAWDVQNAGAGSFLRPVFNLDHVASKFRGILNGVDATDWCPANDALLPAPFNAELPAGKALCKEFLQKGLGLNVDPAKPLVAVVSRLEGQKNPGLMAAAAYRCAEAGAQFVLLGSGSQAGQLRGMADGPFRDHPDVRILIMYSEALAHFIYAAADVVVVPSNFEPCGLTQMLAMRYGALPCVRRTGGLADTVRDLDTWSGPEEERNGFTFDGADHGSLHSALDRALALFRADPTRWREVSRRNMKADVSWAQPAAEYLKLYYSIAASD